MLKEKSFLELRDVNNNPSIPSYIKGVLKGTECTAAWCSIDNWQPLTCGVYFYGELKGSNGEKRVVLVRGQSMCKFYIYYLIKTTDRGPYTY